MEEQLLLLENILLQILLLEDERSDWVNPIFDEREKCGEFHTGLFISPSGISELDCATTTTDTAERNISIGRESLQVFFFVLRALAYFQVPPLGGIRDEKWRSQ